MRLLERLLIAALIFVLGSLPAAAQKTTEQFEIIDIMPAFWQFWDKAEKADPAAQAKLFREIVIGPQKEVFEGFTGSPSDEDLGRYFKQVTKLVPRLRKVSGRLQTELPNYRANFQKTFPDMRWAGSVYFMPNFGATDSGTGELNGKTVLIFGVDTIAALYGEDANLATLFDHELFHLYHDELHPEWRGKSRWKEEVPMYWLLWTEGLATYVSKVMNPDVPLEKVLLTKSVVQDADLQLGKLAKDLSQTLDLKAKDVWLPYLSNDRNDKGIPPRSGYYIGMLVAEQLSKKYSLKQLSRLTGSKLKREMKAALQKMAPKSR